MDTTNDLLKLALKLNKAELSFINKTSKDLDVFLTKPIYEEICNNYELSYSELLKYSKKIGIMTLFEDNHDGFICDIFGEIVIYDNFNQKSKKLTLKQRRKKLDYLMKIFKEKKDQIVEEEEKMTKNNLFMISVTNALHKLEKNANWNFCLGDQLDFINNIKDLQNKENLTQAKDIILNGLKEYNPEKKRLNKSELNIFLTQLEEYYNLANL